jgi:hypothetical protein
MIDVAELTAKAAAFDRINTPELFDFVTATVNEALRQRGLDGVEPPIPGIDWVIVGGESGQGARPCNVEWIEDILAQCTFAGVPCFVKQLGKWIIGDWREFDVQRRLLPDDALGLSDSKGGDPSQWPERLRVRQFPAALPGEEAPAIASR